MHWKYLKDKSDYNGKVHSFLNQSFAQSSLFTICLEVSSANPQVNLNWRPGWKYPQIVSIKDCAKHCFKNEWTLNICKSKWFLIMVLMVCFILVFLMDLMVTCVIFALFYRPQAALPERILDKSNRKAPTKWYNLKVGRKVVVFFFCLYLLWPSFIIEEARLGLG